MTYIGIDQSINSTGICINEEQYMILKPKYRQKEGKRLLTKREEAAEREISTLEYKFYEAEDLSVYAEHTEWREWWKSWNLASCADKIAEIVSSIEGDVTVTMEGLSYGSTRASSLCDLAGLSFLIRDRLMHNGRVTLHITEPSKVKKFAVGKGNATKELISDMFLITHPEYKTVPKIDDLADAFFMCNIGKHINE